MEERLRMVKDYRQAVFAYLIWIHYTIFCWSCSYLPKVYRQGLDNKILNAELYCIVTIEASHHRYLLCYLRFPRNNLDLFTFSFLVHFL